MRVVKRSGRTEEIKFDKIIKRIKSLSKDFKIDPAFLAQKTISGLHDNIETKNIDLFLAETAAVLSAEHPNYGRLAARVLISSLHKDTLPSFIETTKILFDKGVVHKLHLKKVLSLGPSLDDILDYERDFEFDFFGYKTLERSYLIRADDRIIERPQHLFMRVAVHICSSLEDIKKLYDMMSKGVYTHATPTLFNAGTKHSQLSSCFLEALEDDSIEGIFSTLKDVAFVSKHAGGVGLHIHNLRAAGSHIEGTNGKSSGIVPFLKIFNETARAVDQAGRRKGSFAIFLEPWHRDIEQFLDLKKPTGSEELRARDLFLALWVPDLFMQRVKDDKDWTLMCPNECPDLSDVFGDDFNSLYERYEKDKPSLRKVKARELMSKIIESMLESGVPYICFKDAANKKSNQKNLGTIKSSNLCVEIMEFSSPSETAVCNLASLCLPKFLCDGKFDFHGLRQAAYLAAKNLNSVIDETCYPIHKAMSSNIKHRPIGLGLQGLCDIFFSLEMAYDSDEAKALDEKIFATIYYGALEASCDLAKETEPYRTYEGSPASQGQLQFDLWEKEPCDVDGLLDWSSLKDKIKEHGLRNSLLIALMPTASTSQIFGNTECFEVVTSNLYKRQTLAGEFVVINKHLVKKLESLNLWNEEIRNKITEGNGSIQHIDEIPEDVRKVFRTVWEISQREVIDHAAVRAPYVCQSQSMNLFFAKPSFGAVNSALFYAWSKGLKTGCYYTRTRAAADAAKVTTKLSEAPEVIACSIENPETCLSCQ